jgi:ribosomal protein S18 acetylase RimI-like enzyme
MTVKIQNKQHTANDKMNDYIWRPASKIDAPAIFEMRLAVDQVDGTDHAGTLANLEREFEDPWVGDVTKDTILILTPDGAVAGCGFVYVNPEPVLQRRAFLWFAVHPEHRPAGLQDKLLAWLETRGTEVVQGLKASLPCALHTGSQDTLKNRMALCEARGYRIIRNFYRMKRDLRQPFQALVLPEGITLCNYKPDLDQSLREAFNLAFADHWDFEPVTEEDWRLWMVAPENLSPELTYIAMAGDEIAAFSMNGVSEEENQRNGVKEGWIHGLGTRREWRRRGLAASLLNVSMGAFRNAGLDYATLGVDSENTTGALGLYERLGFEPVKRYIRYEKKIAC